MNIRVTGIVVAAVLAVTGIGVGARHVAGSGAGPAPAASPPPPGVTSPQRIPGTHPSPTAVAAAIAPVCVTATPDAQLQAVQAQISQGQTTKQDRAVRIGTAIVVLHAIPPRTGESTAVATASPTPPPFTGTPPPGTVTPPCRVATP